MDNLTHSLIGAVLGQAGLKHWTGLAMPALILAANLPDIDAPCVIHGVESLSMRRGITHGPIALAVLPAILAGVLLAVDRWQTWRGTRPPGRARVRPGRLLTLCYIAALTHPAFDWLNSYGIRLLEPFSHRWFYGDALFIVDPWLLAVLGLGVWFSVRRDRAGSNRWTRPAQAAIACALAYVALNIGISRVASASVLMGEPYPKVTVANPVPGAFWRREVLWRVPGEYGSVPFSLFGPRVRAIEARATPTNMDDPRIAERVARSPAGQAFLFWSRLPVAEMRGDVIVLTDQRFMQGPTRGNFSVELKPR